MSGPGDRRFLSYVCRMAAVEALKIYAPDIRTGDLEVQRLARAMLDAIEEWFRVYCPPIDPDPDRGSD